MPRADNKPGGCFYFAFFLLGLVLSVLFGYLMIWPPLRANLFFSETTCVVLDKRLAEQDGEDGKSSRPEIHIEYTSNGVPHRTWTYDAAGVFTNLHDANRRTLERFQVGQRYPCWFDPAQPDRAVLTRHFTWWCLMVLIPLAFLVFGACGLLVSKRSAEPQPAPPAVPAAALWPVGLFFGGFLVAVFVSFTLVFTLGGIGKPFWLTALMFFGPFAVFTAILSVLVKRHTRRMSLVMPSPERTAALTLQSADSAIAPTESEGDTKNEWPTIPTLHEPPTPGRTLRYRLPSGSSPVRVLVITLAAALFWNGIVSIFLSTAIEGHLGGKPDWFMTVLLVPFVLVGLVLIPGSPDRCPQRWECSSHTGVAPASPKWLWSARHAARSHRVSAQ